MKKIGIILTSSSTKDIVASQIVAPLKNMLQISILINDDVLKFIVEGERKKAEALVIKEIRKFKAKGIYNIIFACSSISYFKTIAVKEKVNIFAIDDFLAKESRSFKKIEFLATAKSALKSGSSLFSSSQKVSSSLIEGAFEFLLSGDKEKHNKLIVDFILSLPKNTKCIVLAQVSMLYALEDILKITKMPVLSGATTLVKNLLLHDKPYGIELYDSISYAKEEDRNKFIVSGSHGGAPAVRYAIDKRIFGAVFNDAGVGKNKAGISGLSLLDEKGILGIAVDVNSAEIGNSKDTYENGIISYSNDTARDFGVQKNMRVKDFIKNLNR